MKVENGKVFAELLPLLFHSSLFTITFSPPPRCQFSPSAKATNLRSWIAKRTLPRCHSERRKQLSVVFVVEPDLREGDLGEVGISRDCFLYPRGVILSGAQAQSKPDVRRALRRSEISRDSKLRNNRIETLTNLSLPLRRGKVACRRQDG